MKEEDVLPKTAPHLGVLEWKDKKAEILDLTAASNLLSSGFSTRRGGEKKELLFA